jgi:hypothetical protein
MCNARRNVIVKTHFISRSGKLDAAYGLFVEADQCFQAIILLLERTLMDVPHTTRHDLF